MKIEKTLCPQTHKILWHLTDFKISDFEGAYQCFEKWRGHRLELRHKINDENWLKVRHG